MDVTAVIITKNEEKNITDCIRSISGFAERILIIDSGSTDKTCEMAAELGCEVHYHEFETHAKQRNWAIDNLDIKTKWILRLDADERFTPEFTKEVTSLMQKHSDDDVNGIAAEAWLYFMGRRIKHGCRNKRKILLFKTGKGRIEDRRVDEHTVLTEGVSVETKERFIHYDFKDMSNWINKLNWYATKEVQDYIEYTNGKRTDYKNEDAALSAVRKKKFGFYYKLPMFVRCYMLFIYFYVFKLGFLDGKEGFIYNYMYHRWYRTLVDCKIFEYKKNPDVFGDNSSL